MPQDGKLKAIIQDGSIGKVMTDVRKENLCFCSTNK